MKTTMMKIMFTAALLGVPPAMNADSIVSFAVRQSTIVQVTEVWADMPELTAVEESFFTAPTPEKTVFTLTASEPGSYTSKEATAFESLTARIVVDINQFVIGQNRDTQSKSPWKMEDDEVVRFDYKKSAPRAA